MFPVLPLARYLLNRIGEESLSCICIACVTSCGLLVPCVLVWPNEYQCVTCVDCLTCSVYKKHCESRVRDRRSLNAAAAANGTGGGLFTNLGNAIQTATSRQLNAAAAGGGLFTNLGNAIPQKWGGQVSLVLAATTVAPLSLLFSVEWWRFRLLNVVQIPAPPLVLTYAPTRMRLVVR